MSDKDPISWREGNYPFSKIYNDIYFDIENGLAESRFVFLEPNRIKERSNQDLRVAEFGFGTGLNFFACAQEFLKHSKNSRLHYFSCEKYPLSPAAAKKALQRWPEIKDLVDEFFEYYFRLPEGFLTFEICGGRIRVQIYFGDALDYIKNIQGSIDAWFFDGFAPAKNPEMWSNEITEQVGLRSHHNTSFSSFSSAGFFRRNLQAAGAEVFKQAGYGRKREMSFGKFSKLGALPEPKKIPHAAIIGSGISGAQVAKSLDLRSIPYQVFESENEIAALASGNPLSLVMPYLMSAKSERIMFSSSAFTFQRSRYAGSEFFHTAGVDQFFYPEKKMPELRANLQNFDWPEEFCTRDEQKLQFWRAGILQSKKYLADFWQNRKDQLHLASKISRIERRNDTHTLFGPDEKSLGEFSHVFCAAAYATLELIPDTAKQLRRTRGQLAFIENAAAVARTQTFGNYLSPKIDGHQVFGGTYRHENFDDQLRDEEFEELKKNYADFYKQTPKITGGRAGVRCHTQNNWPLIGEENGIGFLVGMGSRGFSESGLAAETLISMTLQETHPVNAAQLQRLKGL